jgi:hypothetical protein
LKTRNWEEVRAALVNMVGAARVLRDRLGSEPESQAAAE